MKQLADDVWQLGGFPPNAVNAYLAGGVLFDAGLRARGGSYLRQLRGRTVAEHALTHGHGDHQGSSARICRELGIPLACPALEADAVAAGRLGPLLPSNPMAWLTALTGGPAVPVARRLVEGDEVGGFRVIDVPGHSPGHVAYWREADRTLILGDVLTNVNVFTMVPGLHQPPRVFTVDPARNRRSAKRLLELGIVPALVCFGHGAPLRDPGRFADFIRNLPD